ncbi:MAG: amino acid decarboxylase, partial [Oscillospiraceae bacterium]|nr:amino acid decarboxylase [Oscillospiraceae bacterium]
MDTPVYDFVRAYAEQNGGRLHMPGHKGVGRLGCEMLDITEIAGADALYEANGIIAESERNAAELFGSGHTYYSTEGS